MDLRPPRSFFTSASSPLESERNLPASCSMLLSSVTSTFSTARATKPGGILMSWAASGASARHRQLMLRIDSMNLLLYELQLAAGDTERQQNLLFGQLPLRADAALALEFQAAGQQQRGGDGGRPPAAAARSDLRLREHARGESRRRIRAL